MGEVAVEACRPFVQLGLDCRQLQTEDDISLRSQASPAPLPPLPQPFLRYLAKSGIDASIYAAAKNLPRYVRIKENLEDEIPNIESEIGHLLSSVPWLRGFYSLPQEASIARTQAYQLGKIYGMDAASGAAVQALGVVPGDHVLDLCAAPGAKLCMIAEYLQNSGTVTGVDIAHHRLSACRTMLLKYGLGNCCRLFVADGTNFNLLPHRIGSGTVSFEERSSITYKEWSSRKTRQERKRNARRAASKYKPDKPELLFYGNYSGVVGLRKEQVFENCCEDEQQGSEFGYDKILVDAECTHDGSLKHVFKYEHWGWDTLERRLLDSDRLNSITDLQLSLLTNGFRLLKVGGSLVYSTCSFTTAQNEEVVENFLARHTDAELIEIEDAKKYNWPYQSGYLTQTLRFDPLNSLTSGLFVAKIKKHAN